MTEPKEPTSWWQTLPGMMTALAAVITAFSGLLGLLYQNGVFHGKADQAQAASTAPSVGSVSPVGSTSPVGTAPAVTTADANTATAAANQPASKPWSDMTAVVLSQNGSTTKVRADSLSNCISVNHELSLTSGQDIAFEKMSSFEVTHADDHTSSTAKAQIKITLVNGSTISGAIEANCDLFGNNDVGRFTTYYDQVRAVRFE